MELVMGTLGDQNLLESEKTFSPAEVRKMLNSDNQEIQRLCKELSVFPKKDNATGRIFFFKSDIDILRRVKDLYEKTQKTIEKKVDREPAALVEVKNSVAPITENQDVNLVLDTLVDTRENIVSRLTGIIEEKLEGIDDIVVELIKSRVENEKLKMKMDQLTKENYRLISEMDKYKSVGFGLYKKTRSEI